MRLSAGPPMLNRDGPLPAALQVAPEGLLVRPRRPLMRQHQLHHVLRRTVPNRLKSVCYDWHPSRNKGLPASGRGEFNWDSVPPSIAGSRPPISPVPVKNGTSPHLPIETVDAIKIVDFREPQSDLGMRPRTVSNWRPFTEIVVLCAPDNYRRDRLVSTENLD